MDKNEVNYLIEQAENYFGKELLVIKDLPNSKTEKKFFIFFDIDWLGYGKITSENSFINQRIDEYSFDVWAILQSEDGNIINRINLKRVIQAIDNDLPIYYNF